jgi:hypothetical protein
MPLHPCDEAESECRNRHRRNQGKPTVSLRPARSCCEVYRRGARLKTVHEKFIERAKVTRFVSGQRGRRCARETERSPCFLALRNIRRDVYSKRVRKLLPATIARPPSDEVDHQNAKPAAPTPTANSAGMLIIRCNCRTDVSPWAVQRLIRFTRQSNSSDRIVVCCAVKRCLTLLEPRIIGLTCVELYMLLPSTRELLTYVLINGRQPLWLPEMDFINAFLAEADLSSANLRRARLDGANLDSAILRKAMLSAASMQRASLKNTDLTDADLSKASLHGANLTDANLTGTVLTEALYDSETLWPPGFDPAAAGATLSPAAASPQ